jgi:hypothetical protein
MVICQKIRATLMPQASIDKAIRRADENRSTGSGAKELRKIFREYGQT